LCILEYVYDENFEEASKYPYPYFINSRKTNDLPKVIKLES
jgi:hypothetical protein